MLSVVLLNVAFWATAQCEPDQYAIFDLEPGDVLVYQQSLIYDSTSSTGPFSSYYRLKVLDLELDSSVIHVNVDGHKSHQVYYDSAFLGFYDCGGGRINAINEMPWFRPNTDNYALYSHLAKDSSRRYRMFTGRLITGTKDSLGYYDLSSIRHSHELEIVYGEGIGMFRKTTRLLNIVVVQQLVSILRGSDTITVYSAVENVKTQGIAVYPVPALDVVHFNSNYSQGKYQITGVSGKVKMEGDINTKCNILNINKLTPGVYWLKLETQEGVLVKKFIKR